MAKGARQLGASIHRNTEVTGIEHLPSGEWKVATNQGDIVCEHVVTATGNYAQQTAGMLGLKLPCFPVVHQYWVTETVPEVRERKAQGLPEMPVLRNEAINGYVREERDGLMFGPYERPHRLEHFARDGVPDWFGADLLPEDMEAVEENWEAALELVPVLGEVGIQANVRGPICVTPDNLPLCGPAWGRRNLWLAEGFSGGILMGGGIGHELTNWIIDGEPGIDLSEVDPQPLRRLCQQGLHGPQEQGDLRAQFRHPLPGLRMAGSAAGQDRAVLRPAEGGRRRLGRGLWLGSAFVVRTGRCRAARRLELPHVQFHAPCGRRMPGRCARRPGSSR